MEGTSSALAYSDFEPIVSAITTQVNTDVIIAILAGIAGASILMVVTWWGARKVTGGIMAAFKRGKLRL